MRRKRTRPVTTAPAPVAVYRDKLLRVLLVAEHGGRLYLVPRRPDGWQARQEIAMTESARSERLTVARDVTPEMLGIPSEKTGPTLPQDERGRGDLTNESDNAPMRQTSV